jgi:hypothetical protein
MPQLLASSGSIIWSNFSIVGEPSSFLPLM